MFVRLELSEKTLSLPKYGDIILNSMTQTREKWESKVLGRPDFWMVCVYCYSLFRTNSKKEHLNKNDFRRCYGNFFESAILKVT